MDTDKASGKTAGEGGGYGDLPGVHITANQLVARNLLTFRKAAGLTQEELGEMLGWSAAVVSAAERSWDAKRVRQFTADDIVAIAAALNIPIPALYLPLEDDGVSVRYLMHVPGESAAESAESICWDMHTLMIYVMSEPADDDDPAPRRYRERYVSALNLYLGAERAAELSEYVEDLSTEDRVEARLERLRGQYLALREILADNDHMQEMLQERVFLARTERRQWRPRHEQTDSEREEDEKIAQLITEMFGSADVKLSKRQMDQVVAEARRRSIFGGADGPERQGGPS